MRRPARCSRETDGERSSGSASPSSTLAERSKAPAAIARRFAPAPVRHSAALDGDTGIGLDPCGALRTHVTLAAGNECDLLAALGDAGSIDAAQALVTRYRAIDFDAVLRDVRTSWNEILDTVSVRTPDAALDVLVNDWLLYQTLACRVWARTAYYQASGAYGFRDQLQDVMALCIARP